MFPQQGVGDTYMTFIIFVLAWSLVLVLILGFVVLRKWLRKRVDLAVWSAQEPHEPGNPSAEHERAAWNGNKDMQMK
jgi:hypothetical protein